MLAAELAADLREAVLGEAFAEVHRHLSRHGYLPGVVFRLQLVHAQPVVARDRPLYLLDCDSGRLVVFRDVAYGVLREHLGDGQAPQRGNGNQPYKRAFQLAYVALNLARYKEGHVVWK